MRPVRVLVVEDEILISELVGEALSERGFVVEMAASAEEALDLLQAGTHIDVLFTDINLPGMSGDLLALKAREIVPSLAVIFASGRWGLLEKLQGMPHSAVLAKPYSLGRACDTVDQLMARTA